MSTKKKKLPKPKKRYPKPADFSPEPFFPADWKAKAKRGRPRCQAWNGNKGRQCENLPVKGRGHPAVFEEYKTTCGSHGGKTPSGIASPHWKHGRYSDDLPSGLFQDYVRSLDDKDLISLKDELALVVSFIKRDLRELASLRREAGPGALDFYNDMITTAATDPVVGARMLEELGDVLRAGEDLRQVEARIFDRLEQRRKIAESERRRLVDARSVVTKEKLRNLIVHVGMTIRDIVSDPEEKRRIIDRLKLVLLDR